MAFGKTLLVAMMLAVAGAHAQIPFERTEECGYPALGTRRRQTREPLLFAEVIAKYGVYQNFLHYYIERPLFTDRTLRDEHRFENYTRRNFLEYEIPAVKAAGLDGFGTFCVSGRSAVFQYLPWLLEEREKEFLLLPEYLYGERIPPNQGRNLRVDAIAVMINQLRNTPNAPKTTDGRLLMGSWNSQVLTLEEHQRLMAAMRAAAGGPDFCLTGEIHLRTREGLEGEYRRHGTLNLSQRELYRQSVQDVLDLFGGLQMCVQNRTRSEMGDFQWDYGVRYFQEERLPMLQEIFRRPENQDKVLGCIVYQGYVNPMLGFVIGEYGTASLRHGMDESLKLNPDYILLFEWNEANENTQFQPTVYNGRAISRLLRFYSQVMKGRPLAPMPGDDTTLPNAVVSYRATLKLGERLALELLNVPDGSMKRDYTLQLELRSATGKCLHAFPVERMQAGKLHAVTYRLPSEQFASEEVLQPVLKVDGREVRGLGAIRLAATHCVNYKELRQAVRELLAPKSLEFTATPIGGGRYQVDARVDAGTPLASVELLDGEDEVAAVDKDNEFDPARNLVFQAGLTTLKILSEQPLVARVEGVSRWAIRPAQHCNVFFGTWERRGDAVHFPACRICPDEFALLVTVPRAEAEKAVLSLNLPGHGEWKLPLAPAARHGVYALTLEEPLRVDIRRLDNLPDVPMPVGAATAELHQVVRSDRKSPCFHLRVIAKDGRFLRTKARIPAPLQTAPAATLDVFSDTLGKPLKVSVPQQALADIEYIFDPRCGDAIGNTLHPQYNGQLGGGFPYMEAFWEENGNQAHGPQPPPGNGRRAPQWTREDGRWALAFDGRSYINFPNTVMPNGAFTVEFEVKPRAFDGIQVLFRHANRFTGSVAILLDNQLLQAQYLDKMGRKHRLESGLAVPADQWSKVSVSYDFSQMTFAVNGQRRALPLTGRPFLFKPSIFGGHIGPEGVNFQGRKTSFYQGLLRRLTIRQYAMP